MLVSNKKQIWFFWLKNENIYHATICTCISTWLFIYFDQHLTCKCKRYAIIAPASEHQQVYQGYQAIIPTKGPLLQARIDLPVPVSELHHDVQTCQAEHKVEKRVIVSRRISLVIINPLTSFL